MEQTTLQRAEILGKRIEIYGNPETPLFLAKDVAEWIEHSNVASMVKSIDDDEKLIETMFISGQSREVIMLTEDGVYEILMQSRKPIAKQFKKGIKQILQSIRKTGGYIATSEQDTPETIMARAILVAKETIDRQKAQLEAQAPRVLFARSVESSSRSILIGELAKIINQNGVNIGQNRLFEILRQKGYLGQRGEYYNIPTQRAMDMGLFEIKKTSILRSDGSTLVTTTTKVTGRGSVYFVNKFLKKQTV